MPLLDKLWKVYTSCQVQKIWGYIQHPGYAPYIVSSPKTHWVSILDLSSPLLFHIIG